MGDGKNREMILGLGQRSGLNPVNAHGERRGGWMGSAGLIVAL